MTSTYPSLIASLTNPNSTDRLNSPSHSTIETSQNNEITQIENVIGTSASTLGTIIGDLRNPNSPGGGHIQTANKGGTGLTSYNKGDVLVAQSASVLAKLAITPNDGLAIVADSTQSTGIKWGVPNSKPTIKVFSIFGTASSVFTYSKPATLSYARIIVQAPGGAGSSVLSNSNISTGGSAGGYAETVIAASSLLSSEEIRVGGPGQISSTAAGISSFGLLNVNASIIASGGLTGVKSTTDVQGPVGGSTLGAVISIPGGPGKYAFLKNTTQGVGGDGGDSPLGKGGSGALAVSNSGASSPAGYGAGGAGGASDAAGGNGTASAGAPGIVIVEEY